MIKQIDAIELLKSLPDNSVDLIFTDPPYALGSEVIIRADGKPDYKKAVDFMNKWDQPDGKFWEEWFKEANRVLKYGGRVLMFGMDRQLMLNKYYACFAGLQEQQSLYWYFASSFPKASDLSKNLDKYFGEEREIVSVDNTKIRPNRNDRGYLNEIGGSGYNSDNGATITKPSSPLVQKYDGFKYSISPVKQTNETIMVFQKPYKTGSCLHDTLSYENGDKECCCGALNIDGNRVELETNCDKRLGGNGGFSSKNLGWSGLGEEFRSSSVAGRFPAQSFVDSETAKLLDEQSGQKTSGAMKATHNVGKTGKDGFMPHHGIYGKYKARPFQREVEASIGGCSKILHKCDYDEKDIELYYYCPKVDKKERDLGNIENNHPTVKPISLLLKILNLFKTPNPQVCIDTFAGSASIPIAAKLLGFEVIAGDLDEAFVEIANARLDYAIKNKVNLREQYKSVNLKTNESLNEFF